MPRGLAPVLLRATAKDPSARYPSGAAMIEALRALESTVAPTVTAAVASPAAPASPVPGAPTVVSAAAPRGRGVRTAAALAAAAVLIAALVWIGVALRPPRPLPGHRLVAEEDIGFLGRLLGREPRLLVTLPAGTVLHLALDAPLSSENAVTGDDFVAEMSRPVRVEGVEAVPGGSRVRGRVTHAASAEQAAGRGEMTLELESVELADGGRIAVRSKPLGLRAPVPRKKDNTLIESLSGLGSAVGELIGGRRGAAAGTVVGGTAGAMVVTTSRGREVALGTGAPLSVELLEPVKVARPKQP